MPFPKSQVCILIEVSGGNFPRHSDLSGFIQLIIQPADDSVRCASGYIQDFGDVCCRQELPRRGILHRLMIRHSNLLSGGTYGRRHPHDTIIILSLFKNPRFVPPVLNFKQKAPPLRAISYARFDHVFSGCAVRCFIRGCAPIVAHCPRNLYNSRRRLFDFQGAVKDGFYLSVH